MKTLRAHPRTREQTTPLLLYAVITFFFYGILIFWHSSALNTLVQSCYIKNIVFMTMLIMNYFYQLMDDNNNMVCRSRIYTDTPICLLDYFVGCLPVEPR